MSVSMKLFMNNTAIKNKVYDMYSNTISMVVAFVFEFTKVI